MALIRQPLHSCASTALCGMCDRAATAKAELYAQDVHTQTCSTSVTVALVGLGPMATWSVGMAAARFIGLSFVIVLTPWEAK